MKIELLPRRTIHLYQKQFERFPCLELSAFREVKPAERARWTVALLKKNLDAQQGAVLALRDHEGLLGVAGVRLLAFDTNYFGVKMGRIGPFHLADRATPSQGRRLAEKAVRHLAGLGCRFADCRVYTADLKAARALEATGFYLGDTTVAYAFRVAKTPRPSIRHKVKLRWAKPEDRAALASLTEQTFTGYIGRFHQDPFFDAQKATQMYVRWLENSLDGLADEILVAQVGRRIAGFLTLELEHAQNKVVATRFGEGVLAGVAPWSRGKGVYTSLLAGCLPWFAEHCDIGIVATQVDNVAVQNAWARLGYRLVLGRYAFHWRK